MTGTELRNARIRRGLLQKQLARRLRVAGNTISCYETGKRRISPQKAILLRAALKPGVESQPTLHKDVDFSTDEPTPELME